MPNESATLKISDSFEPPVGIIKTTNRSGGGDAKNLPVLKKNSSLLLREGASRMINNFLSRLENLSNHGKPSMLSASLWALLPPCRTLGAFLHGLAGGLAGAGKRGILAGDAAFGIALD